jgi:hypothetical protein
MNRNATVHPAMQQRWLQLLQLAQRQHMLLLQSCVHPSARGVLRVLVQHQERHLTLQAQQQKHV